MVCVKIFEALKSNVCINLGGRDVSMPEQKLHNTQISAVIEQMGCEGVAKNVRRKMRSDPCNHSVLLDQLPESLA